MGMRFGGLIGSEPSTSLLRCGPRAWGIIIFSVKHEVVSEQEHLRMILRTKARTCYDLIPISCLTEFPNVVQMAKLVCEDVTVDRFSPILYPKASKLIVTYDEHVLSNNFKFGVIYQKFGQVSVPPRLLLLQVVHPSLVSAPSLSAESRWPRASSPMAGNKNKQKIIITFRSSCPDGSEVRETSDPAPLRAWVPVPGVCHPSHSDGRRKRSSQNYFSFCQQVRPQLSCVALCLEASWLSQMAAQRSGFA
ncbi:uncharacterized protein LOC142923471 [Petromyzon marinus]|uniref:uncharacterized protein LOC142923471 n=1 Tax=Petromyzon marinus TaxID=7757 RepID=UPI003F6E8DBF